MFEETTPHKKWAQPKSVKKSDHRHEYVTYSTEKKSLNVSGEPFTATWTKTQCFECGHSPKRNLRKYKRNASVINVTPEEFDSITKNR